MPNEFFGGRRDLLWRKKRFLERFGIALHPITSGHPIAVAIYHMEIPADMTRGQALQMIRAIRSSPDLKLFRHGLAPALMRIAGRNYRNDPMVIVQVPLARLYRRPDL